MKKYLVPLLTILFILFSGCLNSEENVKPINPDSLNILDVVWAEAPDQIHFSIKMNYLDETNGKTRIFYYISKTPQPINLEGKDIFSYDNIRWEFLQTGVNIYSAGSYKDRDYNYNEIGKVYLFIHDENGKLIKYKIIDPPHYDAKFFPSDTVMYSSEIMYPPRGNTNSGDYFSPYYLTVENTGNMPLLLTIGPKKNLVYGIVETDIGFEGSPVAVVRLLPGEKEQFNLYIDFHETIYDRIAIGDSGITEIIARYEYQGIQGTYYEIDTVKIKWVVDELVICLLDYSDLSEGAMTSG